LYAESVSDGRIWPPAPGDLKVYVPLRRFDSCLGIGSTDARIVGMVRLDLEVNNRWRLT